MRTALMLSLLVPFTPAFAATVPTGFTPPQQVTMFRSASLLNARGAAKGRDCHAAVLLAEADLRRVAGHKKETLVALYDGKPTADWTSAAQATCTFEGKASHPKKSVVQLRGLAVRAGKTATYRPIAGTRVPQIMSAFVDASSLVAFQVSTVHFEDYRGALYLSTGNTWEKTFSPGSAGTAAR